MACSLRFGLAVLMAYVLFSASRVRAADDQPHAPPPRPRADVQAVLDKAPKPAGELRPLRIVLVAGPKDHGLGQHDYPLWQKTWQPLIAKAKNVTVTTAWKWPTADQMKEADLIVCFFKSPWSAEQVADIKALHARGGGMVSIHWAITPEKGAEKQHQEIVGLDYASAQYRHGPIDLKFTADHADHPILLGLPQPLHFFDEAYWPIIGDRSKVNILASSAEKLAKDDTQTIPIPIFWTYEAPAGKGRSFVSVLGHYTWTFDDPYFRLLLLRGMAWSAGESPYRFDALSVDGVKFAGE